MSPIFQEALASLGRLSAVRLDETSRRIRKSLAQAEWKMSLCLLAMVRTGGFRELGYATISEYGEKVLNLSGKKLGWLLGTARALEHLPLLSEAFKRGEIGWGKVRAIQSLATPETERRWLDFALSNPTETVVKKVALSPTQWKRHRALEASLRREPVATVEAVEEVLKTRAEFTSENLSGQESTSRQGRAFNQEAEKAAVFRPLVEVGATSLRSQGELEGETSQAGELVLETHRPDRIRLVVEFTPDQYALYEAAEKRLRARAGRRVGRGEVLVQLAERVLAEGTARSRARHQILIHTCENCRNAWYETDQGVHPVGREVLEKAREESSPLRVDPLPENEALPIISEATIRQSRPLFVESDGESQHGAYGVSEGLRDSSSDLSPSTEADPGSRDERALPPIPPGENSWPRRSAGSEISESSRGRPRSEARPPSRVPGAGSGPPSRDTGVEDSSPSGFPGSEALLPSRGPGSEDGSPSGGPGAEAGLPSGGTGSEESSPSGVPGAGVGLPSGGTGSEARPLSGVPGAESGSPSGVPGAGVGLPSGGTGSEARPLSGVPGAESGPPSGVPGAGAGLPIGGTGSEDSPPSKSTGREYIPNATLRALFARASNCCERCRARSAHLQVHHVVPVSEGGGNHLEQLRLYCRACHTLHHEKDFQEKPGWRRARDAATAEVGGEVGLGRC